MRRRVSRVPIWKCFVCGGYDGDHAKTCGGHVFSLHLLNDDDLRQWRKEQREKRASKAAPDAR